MLENMRLARMAAPVNAAQGVAARTFHVTMPKSAASPSVQMVTGADCRLHQCASRTTCAPTPGSTASKTSLDCQRRSVWATFYRNLRTPLKKVADGRVGMDSLITLQELAAALVWLVLIERFPGESSVGLWLADSSVVDAFVENAEHN